VIDMRTAVAAAEPPEGPPVAGGGFTYAGPGFTISWPSTGTSTSVLAWVQIDRKPHRT
jgi:hypothetical protein